MSRWCLKKSTTTCNWSLVSLKLSEVWFCADINLGKSIQKTHREFVDGIQNIYKVLEARYQHRYSNLGDAYKWNQLGSSSVKVCSECPDYGSAEPRDPYGNIAWGLGMVTAVALISSRQLPAFRRV